MVKIVCKIQWLCRIDYLNFTKRNIKHNIKLYICCFVCFSAYDWLNTKVFHSILETPVMCFICGRRINSTRTRNRRFYIIFFHPVSSPQVSITYCEEGAQETCLRAQWCASVSLWAPAPAPETKACQRLRRREKKRKERRDYLIR